VPLTDASRRSSKQKVASEAVNPLGADGQSPMPNVTRVFGRRRERFAFLQAHARGTARAPLIAFVIFFRGIARRSKLLRSRRPGDARNRALPLQSRLPSNACRPDDPSAGSPCWIRASRPRPGARRSWPCRETGPGDDFI
jgi:hypothetical protein